MNPSSEAPTSFALIAHLDAAAQAHLLDLLRTEAEPRLKVQPRGHARGRRSCWLAWEPAFGTTVERTPQPRGDLFERLAQLVPDAELAECWRNGEQSSAGITPHRDANYADVTAWLINLGPTRFRIWLPRDERPSEPLRLARRNRVHWEWQVELTGGEVLQFNCKRLHASRTLARERWAVGLWRFSDTWRRALAPQRN